MKSILKGKKEPTEQTFPRLMIMDCGLVVLFTSRHEGTAVHDPKNDHSIGAYRTDWAISLFEELKGKVTLQN